MHLVLRVQGGKNPDFERTVEVAPGGLLKQEVTKPRGEYDWDTTRSVETTVRIRLASRHLEAPKLPEKTTGKNEGIGYNKPKGTDDINSIAVNEKQRPSGVPDFMDPTAQTQPHSDSNPGPGQGRHTWLRAVLRGKRNQPVQTPPQ